MSFGRILEKKPKIDTHTHTHTHTHNTHNTTHTTHTHTHTHTHNETVSIDKTYSACTFFGDSVEGGRVGLYKINTQKNTSETKGKLYICMYKNIL